MLKKNLQRLYKILFILISKFPPRSKLVIFESYLGKQYSCNPRAIYEYMEEYYPSYELIWSVDKRNEVDFKKRNLKYVNRFSVKWLFAMARARYWISNSRLPIWIPKPSHTIYIQTWHGTPLKKLALDMEEVLMPGTNTEKYKQNFTRESLRWDYLISPNKYSTQIFKRAFAFNNEVIESGYPRNDFLTNYNDEIIINDLKKRYKVPQDKKIILYAPTWRDNEYHSTGKYKFNLALDLDLMRQKLGDEYVILFRMHYLVADKVDLSNFKEFAYDFSHHEDIRELYLISDILITDYSSVFFDYAILNRPVIFFAYDLEFYKDKLRGFYFDYNKVPGPIVTSTNEICQEIRKSSLQTENIPETFMNEFCSNEDGQATARVVKKVFGN